MQSFPPTVILRHRLENLKKCTLRGLEEKNEFLFVTYPYLQLPPLEGYILLKVDAPELSHDDANLGLLLIDSTWRYAEKILKKVEGERCLVARSLPAHYRTAYPRRQDDCPDPQRGLASIEALYLAHHILGRPVQGLLDHYYWKDAFLKSNHLSN